MLDPKLASHCRSSAGKVEPSGLHAQSPPPLLDVQVVLPPSHSEVITTLPLGSVIMSSSPPPAPTPTRPKFEAAACAPSGSPIYDHVLPPSMDFHVSLPAGTP